MHDFYSKRKTDLVCVVAGFLPLGYTLARDVVWGLCGVRCVGGRVGGGCQWGPVCFHICTALRGWIKGKGRDRNVMYC